MCEDRIDNILIDNLIRFTQPQELNDPFEIRPHISAVANDDNLNNFLLTDTDRIIRELYETDVYPKYPNIPYEIFYAHCKKEAPKIEALARHIFKNHIPTMANHSFSKALNKSIGILSLTLKNNNLLMWAHYANSHKGFIVEFDSNNYFFNQTNESKEFYGKLKKVLYTQDRPLIQSFDEIEKEEGKFFNAFLTKSKEWEYEEEYRMLLPLNEASQTIRDEIFLYKFPKQAISSIYLGANMTDANKSRIVELIKNAENRHIKIFETKVASKTFELEFTQIQ